MPFIFDNFWRRADERILESSFLVHLLTVVNFFEYGVWGVSLVFHPLLFEFHVTKSEVKPYRLLTERIFVVAGGGAAPSPILCIDGRVCVNVGVATCGIETYSATAVRGARNLKPEVEKT